jgi:hypothetical protein
LRHEAASKELLECEHDQRSFETCLIISENPGGGMGGSGRQGGSPTVENGLTLDLNRLIRQRDILPGRHISGSLTWSDAQSGEKIASIDFEASLISKGHAWARLRYIDDGELKDYRVQIEATSCHYGGTRWWWVCPISGQRVAKLYLPPGATVFAARQNYRLAYQSQRDAKIDRTHARQRRLYRKLGGAYDHYEQPPPFRPKGTGPATLSRFPSPPVRGGKVCLCQRLRLGVETLRQWIACGSALGRAWLRWSIGLLRL